MKMNFLWILTLASFQATVVFTQEEFHHGWGQCVASTGVQARRVTRPCLVDGGWSDWIEGECRKKDDSHCSDTEGIARAHRQCNNPFPRNGGSSCAGSRYSQINCIREPSCPVAGGWCEWGDWTSCPDCRKYYEPEPRARRFRNCSCPEPRYGGTCHSEDWFGREDEVCANIITCPQVPLPGSTLGPEIDFDSDDSSTTPHPSTLGPEIDWDKEDDIE